MDFKNAVKALQIGKKEGKKFPPFYGIWEKIRKKSSRFRNIRVRRCAGKTGQI